MPRPAAGWNIASKLFRLKSCPNSVARYFGFFAVYITIVPSSVIARSSGSTAWRLSAFNSRKRRAPLQRWPATSCPAGAHESGGDAVLRGSGPLGRPRLPCASPYAGPIEALDGAVDVVQRTSDRETHGVAAAPGDTPAVRPEAWRTGASSGSQAAGCSSLRVTAQGSNRCNTAADCTHFGTATTTFRAARRRVVVGAIPRSSLGKCRWCSGGVGTTGRLPDYRSAQQGMAVAGFRRRTIVTMVRIWTRALIGSSAGPAISARRQWAAWKRRPRRSWTATGKSSCAIAS